MRRTPQCTVMGGRGDFDQFIPRKQWPDKELPEVPEVPQPAPSQASATATADRAQLIADLQTVHDSAANSLESMGSYACEVYLQNKVDTVLAKAGPGGTVCKVCIQKLTTTQNLRAHIISKHMKAKSPYKCQVCDQTFGSFYSLKLHLRQHSSSAKKYRCRICTKEYTTVGHYNEHEGTLRKTICFTLVLQSFPAREELEVP